MPPSHRLRVETRDRTLFVPLADRIRDEAGPLLSKGGVLIVAVPHTTAGVCINEGHDPDVVADVGRVLDRLVPVKDGALELGRWQEVFLCEFDGPRVRTVTLTLLKS